MPGTASCHTDPFSMRATMLSTTSAAAYRNGGDPQRTLSLLATWLGHTHVADTYWYLSASPQLMALAAERLGRAGRSGGER